jgi:hypothetical protein
MSFPVLYYYEQAGIAKALGITDGTDNILFRPNEAATRQDILTFCDKALKAAGMQLTAANESELDRYSDKGSVAVYAKDSICSMIKAGIVKGDGNSLNPLGKATRAEAAVMIYRLYSLYFSA